MSTIKIGDTVPYRGSFGSGPIKRAEVVGLTKTVLPRDKYGTEVTEVSHEDVRANKVVFGLSDGHWCYADQVCLGNF